MKKFLKQLMSEVLVLCLIFTLLPIFSLSAEVDTTIVEETNIAVAIPNSSAINLVSNYFSTGKSRKEGYSMPFLICSSDNSIAKINNEVSDTGPKEITNIYTVGDNIDYTRYFGITEKANVGNGTTYEVDGKSYGVTELDELRSGDDYFKTGVLNTSDFTLDELNASSFYFVPIGNETYTSDYYIYMNFKSTTSNSTYKYYLCVDSALDDESEGYVLDYELKLKRMDYAKEVEDYATKWTLTPTGTNGEFTCSTHADIYEYGKKAKDNILIYLNVGNCVNFSSANYMYIKPLDYLNAKGEEKPKIRLYGNLNMLSKNGTNVGYDGYRIIDDDTTNNIVVKKNLTNGITLPKTSKSTTGNLYRWSINKPIKYVRRFEDYTNGSWYDYYLELNPSENKDLSKIDYTKYGYEPGKTLTSSSQYAGKSFYSVIKYTLTYSATGLANGHSLRVRVGTVKDKKVYASEEIKSGDGVTEGNWVSIAVPLASETGYKYTMKSVTLKDSSGKTLKANTDYTVYESGKQLNAGADYYSFYMPKYAVSVEVVLEKEAVPVNTSASGYFITEGSNGTKNYSNSITKTGLSPIKLAVSTKGIASNGNDSIIIKEYPDYDNEYFVDNDDDMDYTINSCKWYVKVGDNGEYKALNSEITYDGSRATTSTYVYLPSVSKDTKVYYKCEYTVKRPSSNTVGETKELVLSANVTENDVPVNSMYSSYQDSCDNYSGTCTIGKDYYTSGKTYDVGHKLNLKTSRLPNGHTVIISEGPNVEDDTVSNFNYEITWYIQAADESTKAIALNSTPIKISPSSVDNLETSYTCTLPKLLNQKNTDAKLWYEVTKIDKTTGRNRKFNSSVSTLNVNYSGYTPNIEDYDSSLVNSLEEDHLYINASQIKKWEYSTDNGATYTEIPLTSIATSSGNAPLDAVRTNPDPDISVGKNWTSNKNVYGFTVTEAGNYTFRLTNDIDNKSTIKIDFTSLHTHVWSDWIYAEDYHYKKCTVDNCQAVKVGEDHVKNSSGLCTICQNAEPDTIAVNFDTKGGKWVNKYNPPESYKQNETLTLPSADNIEKTGYSFDGWVLSTSTSTEKNYEAKWKCNHTLNTNPRSCVNTTTCSVCNATLGLVDHVLNDGYIHDESSHWQTCENCDTKLNITAHSGGTATCQKQAECSVCDAKYGSKDTTNHEGQEIWLKTDTTHIKKYNCCDAITVSEAAHDYDGNNVCKDCGYENNVCTHIEGTQWYNNASDHWHTCINEGCGTIIKSSMAKHTPNLTAPTETEAVVCTICDYVIAPALGHTFNQKNKEIAGALISPADCTNDAVYYMSCSCGAISPTETFTDDGSALGHIEIIDPRVEPTCTATGLTEGKHCQRCTKILVKQEVLAMLSHNYGEDSICDDCGYDKDHKHSYHLRYDSVNHWQECECGDVIDNSCHVYDDSSDTTCNICGYERYIAPETGNFDSNKPDAKAGISTMIDIILLFALIPVLATIILIAILIKRKKIVS